MAIVFVMLVVPMTLLLFSDSKKCTFDFACITLPRASTVCVSDATVVVIVAATLTLADGRIFVKQSDVYFYFNIELDTLLAIFCMMHTSNK